MIKPLAATAIGTQGVATAATLTLSGDDVFSMTISDGTQSYTASNLIVDIDDTTSTNNFGNAVTEALLGSGINVTMDTSGNVFFRRSDGGAVILQSLTSRQGHDGSMDSLILDKDILQCVRYWVSCGVNINHNFNLFFLY